MADLQDLMCRSEAGEAEACFALGNAYHMGLSGAPCDFDQAERWYSVAARQDHALAWLNLGLLHFQDRPQAGGQCNAPEALRCFERAAALGSGYAMYLAGEMLWRGEGMAQQRAQALEWYVKAAKAGEGLAFNKLGLLAFEGKDVPQNIAKAVDCWTRGARLGHANCQYNLACCHLEGEGVPKDVAQAYPWMLKAAEQGHAAAQYNVGAMLFQGGIGEPDIAGALDWLGKAAKQDHPEALYKLGLCYQYGNGVEVDELTARDLYRRAAELGHVEGTYSFAWMIEHGIMQGTLLHQEGNPAIAAGWYSRAASQGHPRAANNLGMLYAQGLGVAQEGLEARSLFEYAVSLGEDSAMFNLGLLMYYGAPDLAPDLIEAWKWGQLSLRHVPQGNAQKLLDALAKEMTAEQINEAQTRADQWQRTTQTVLWTEEPAR